MFVLIYCIYIYYYYILWNILHVFPQCHCVCSPHSSLHHTFCGSFGHILQRPSADRTAEQPRIMNLGGDEMKQAKAKLEEQIYCDDMGEG